MPDAEQVVSDGHGDHLRAEQGGHVADGGKEQRPVTQACALLIFYCLCLHIKESMVAGVCSLIFVIHKTKPLCPIDTAEKLISD